jgi:hypothetical protein
MRLNKKKGHTIMPYKTMTEVKNANKAIGNHFFDKKTMAFFHSEVESRLLYGRYFVTSERFSVDYPKLYTIREVLSDGSIKTIGEFQSHRTLEGAKETIQRIRKGEE